MQLTTFLHCIMESVHSTGVKCIWFGILNFTIVEFLYIKDILFMLTDINLLLKLGVEIHNV